MDCYENLDWSLTNLIQLQHLNLDFELLKEILDLGAEGAGGLGEDHDRVSGHQLVHSLHGGGGDGRHGGQAPELQPWAQNGKTGRRTIWNKNKLSQFLR